MAATGDAPSSAQVLLGVFTCLLYIVISASLISFNKLLMGRDFFPFATMLTTIHMFVSLVCSLLLYCVAPGLFPAMQATKGTRLQILKYFLPLACFFAMGVALSNEAYMYCTVAFLQTMKQSNVCTMFALSCLVGSQVFDRMKLLLVCWIIAGSAMAVTGEVHFVLLGFLIQMASGLSECGKNLLQEWLLTGGDVKLDPLTYNLFIAPCCLAVLVVVNTFTYDPLIRERILAHWHLLLPNALLAFSLNVTIAFVIKQTSAMGFVLAGIVKDMAIVVASTLLFADALSSQQVLGFSLSTLGIFMWSFVKLQPKHFAVTGFARCLGMPAGDEETRPNVGTEEQPILQKSA